MLELFVLSVGMLVGSVGFGYLPIVCADRITVRKMAMMNALGGGLLIGTALMVIIPEGVHAIAKHPRADALLGPTLAAGFALMLFCENSGIFDGPGNAHSHSPAGHKGILQESELEEETGMSKATLQVGKIQTRA